MKKTYLLDTNIVSEFSKLRPDMQVLELYRARKGLCAISAVTWQELIRGISRMADGRKKRYLEECLLNYEECLEVIPYDKFAARVCGEIQSQMEKDGVTLPFYASQIAATAVSNGMVLVTHNTADFEPIVEKSYLRLEDWFRYEIR